MPDLLAKTTARQESCDGQRSLEQAIKRLSKSIKQAA
jgi:bifunctional non-homologous end joining protein LigD